MQLGSSVPDLKFQNKNDRQYEALFNGLMQDVFGFSFAGWHALNLWDERYESYSLVDRETMLSNICLFRMDMHIGAKKITAYQLGAVATRTGYRNRGLSARLMAQVMEKYFDCPMLLFANKSVLDFYPKFGFKRIANSIAASPIKIDNPQAEAHKLDMEDAHVRRYLYNGRRLSQQIDCVNTQSVAYFHFLTEYGGDIYHLPEIDTLVVARQEKSRLFMPYLNAPEDVDFGRICERLPFSGIESVAFGFTPDRLGIDYQFEKLMGEDEAMFVRGDIQLPEEFAFPALAMT